MEFDDLQLELVGDYVESAVDFLDRFEQLLLEAEARPGDPETLRQILAALHTFKGNSGMMGYGQIQRLAHLLEDVFKTAQSGEAEISPVRLDLILSCTGSVRSAVCGLSSEHPQPPLFDAEISALEETLAAESEATTLTASAPAAPGAPAAGRKSNILKVDFERLDHLLNLVGELVVARTRLAGVEERLPENREAAANSEFTDALEKMGKITTELHEAVMKVRMLPLRQALARFPRMVRDLARARGKEVEFVAEGEEVELDKTVIDEIGEPLLHLLRNSVDHGIETPAERERRGKPRCGTILVRAWQRSSHIMIEVEDDGGGIDTEKLRRRAAEAGVLPAGELGADELMNLVFMPGLSTADAVSEISGRGVGMDVVKESIGRLNGTIEVRSTPGFGARFTIKLPLTLAIIPALLVDAAGERYAVPLAAVTETVKLSPSDVHQINHRPVMSYRGRTLPLLPLAEAMGRNPGSAFRRRYVIVTQTESLRLGLVVDELLGRQEIVVKALNDLASGAAGVAGASILGDGRVVLIVDVPGLAERAAASVETRESVNAH